MADIFFAAASSDWLTSYTAISDLNFQDMNAQLKLWWNMAFTFGDCVQAVDQINYTS